MNLTIDRSYKNRMTIDSNFFFFSGHGTPYHILFLTLQVIVIVNMLVNQEVKLSPNLLFVHGHRPPDFNCLENLRKNYYILILISSKIFILRSGNAANPLKSRLTRAKKGTFLLADLRFKYYWVVKVWYAADWNPLPTSISQRF